ncbi:hypothetical protein [Legionella jamestowniensis]|uniref:Uncharacterized protein n=1 Tax=Legionella jamestowniensis TaxID=455 RepID=A0A0W0UNJ9_9GAMM|nr:hypothetical protein [Legionella jamestowniensis]KTD09407.1 hypothetical protein Ljam_0757 [Legionella jamestowniensis]OCH99233.1 hypothetical protein A8135_08290 [Legionella jamestowniensis]SFL88774.1 hypothetical protein SAMN02746073_2427 [Legionella jamestowniensis DSM 19215]
MNELDILMLFYNEMKAQGKSRDEVFLSMNESAVKTLSEKYGDSVTLEEVHRLTDVCIANEWLERTTIDPGYNFLSLTAAGLQMALVHEYS